MLKKIAVSLLCAIFITGIVFSGFSVLYFILPSRKAQASIHLASYVSDPTTEAAEVTTTAAEPETEAETVTYVADVINSLTLRQTPNTEDDNGTVDLPPMTHLQVSEFTDGNNGNRFAFVTVSSGEYEGLTGFVNAEYITRLGEPTKRVKHNDL